MKQVLKITAICLLFYILIGASAYTAQEDKMIHLILWNDFCIIVRSPTRQLSTMIGQNPLGIILKDNITKVTINNGYLAISIPPSKLEEIITKLNAKKIIFLE
jgi:hypothetical protein